MSKTTYGYDAPSLLGLMEEAVTADLSDGGQETTRDVVDLITEQDPYNPDSMHPSWGHGIQNPVNPDGGPEIMP